MNKSISSLVKIFISYIFKKVKEKSNKMHHNTFIKTNDKAKHCFKMPAGEKEMKSTNTILKRTTIKTPGLKGKRKEKGKN